MNVARLAYAVAFPLVQFEGCNKRLHGIVMVYVTFFARLPVLTQVRIMRDTTMGFSSAAGIFLMLGEF